MANELRSLWVTLFSAIITSLLATLMYSAEDKGKSERANAAIVEDLREELLAQHDSVFTAQIGLTILTALGGPSAKALPLSEFQSFFDEKLRALSASGADDAQIQDAILQFAARAGLSHSGWTDLSIVQDGDTVRNDYAIESDGRRSYVRSPTSDLNYSGTSRTTTLRTGQSPLKMYGFNDVRFLPSKAILAKLAEDSEVVISEEGRHTLIKEPWLKLEFDPKTAFIYRGRIAPRDSTSFTEHWQFGPREFDGGLLLPSVSGMCKGKTAAEGKLAIQMLRVFLLRNATVNARVSEGSFAVEAPVGTRVYVTDDQGKKLLSAKLGRDVSDVHAYLDKVVDAKRRVQATEPERRNGFSVLFYVNAVAIVIVVALLILRRCLGATRGKE